MSHATIGVLLVVACTVIEGFAQTFLKKSSAPAVRKAYWVTLGMGLMAVEAVVYTAALHLLDVSVAYPLGSLSFVAVTVLAQLLLRERVGPKRWVGVALILIGASLVVSQA